MGTRSTTKIYNSDGKLVLALYKQWDGYTDSWGAELKEFIKSGTFVNGINMDNKKVFNGIGCFALQLVAKFKIGAGDLYATTEDDEQGYNYVIKEKIKKSKGGFHEPNGIVISCAEDPKFKEVIK